jgi:hypothetical protein
VKTPSDSISLFLSKSNFTSLSHFLQHPLRLKKQNKTKQFFNSQDFAKGHFQVESKEVDRIYFEQFHSNIKCGLW